MVVKAVPSLQQVREGHTSSQPCVVWCIWRVAPCTGLSGVRPSKFDFASHNKRLEYDVHRLTNRPCPFGPLNNVCYHIKYEQRRLRFSLLFWDRSGRTLCSICRPTLANFCARGRQHRPEPRSVPVGSFHCVPLPCRVKVPQ